MNLLARDFSVSGEPSDDSSFEPVRFERVHEAHMPSVTQPVHMNVWSLSNAVESGALLDDEGVILSVHGACGDLNVSEVRR